MSQENHTIPAPNYTQIPNLLFDEMLPFLKETELKVLLVIYRKTFGWHKTRDQISLTQLQEKTGLAKQRVIKATRSLVEKGLIIKNITGKNGSQKTEYDIVMDQKVPSYKSYPEPVTDCTPPPVTKSTPQKKGLNKYKEKESKPKKIPKTSEQPNNTEALASLDSKESHNTFPFSVEIKEIVHLLIRSLKLLKFDYKIKPKDDVKWAKEVDRMIRLDKRNPEIIKKILKWLPKCDFWHPNIKSGNKLRKQFDTLEIEMNKQNEKDRSERYKAFAYKVKKAGLNSLNVSQQGVYDKSNNFELSYKMPYEDFCRSIANKYGITDYYGDMQ